MNNVTKITPTYQDINECKKKIDAYIDSIDRDPENRGGAYPYYQFHEPGEPIYGTVMMFHGFRLIIENTDATRHDIKYLTGFYLTTANQSS